jgi:putative redox protein
MLSKSGLKKGEVLITPINEKEPFSFITETFDHSIFADEPAELGGNGRGMNPFELLSASLAACTAMTLRFYAKRKNLELGNFQVKVSFAHPLDHSNSTYSFVRELIFNEQKDEELINKLKEIANKCPVHKALEGKVHISTNTISYL